MAIRGKSRKDFIHSKMVRSNWSPTQVFLVRDRSGKAYAKTLGTAKTRT